MLHINLQNNSYELCLAKQCMELLICSWTEEITCIFLNQNGDTALTIAKRMAHDFYKKFMDKIDQIDQIDQNSKCKLSQIWK